MQKYLFPYVWSEICEIHLNIVISFLVVLNTVPHLEGFSNLSKVFRGHCLIKQIKSRNEQNVSNAYYPIVESNN